MLKISIVLAAVLLGSLMMTPPGSVAAQSNEDALPVEAQLAAGLPVLQFAQNNGLTADAVSVTRVTTVGWATSTGCFLADAFDCESFSPGDSAWIIWVQGGAAASGYLVTIAGGLAFIFDGATGSIPASLDLAEDSFVALGALPASGSAGLADDARSPRQALLVAGTAALGVALAFAGARRALRDG